MSFSQRLRSVQQLTNSLVCVGLDTDPGKIPAHLRSADDGVLRFNKQIIQATVDLACAYKINLAFYESMGDAGQSILRETIAAIPPSVITIGDAKRGDIGNTAAMYAKAMFGDLGFAATTVNPYMGSDSVLPFLQDSERGVFILAVTSNPGAKDFQYRKISGKPLYEHVIARVKKWNTKQNCGLVVGATRPAELKRIRAITRDMPFLIPGIGAQGGDLKAAVKFGCDATGTMAVINASRSVLYASSGEDYADQARTAAMSLRDEINRIRDAAFG